METALFAAAAMVGALMITLCQRRTAMVRAGQTAPQVRTPRTRRPAL